MSLIHLINVLCLIMNFNVIIIIKLIHFTFNHIHLTWKEHELSGYLVCFMTVLHGWNNLIYSSSSIEHRSCLSDFNMCVQDKAHNCMHEHHLDRLQDCGCGICICKHTFSLENVPYAVVPYTGQIGVCTTNYTSTVTKGLDDIIKKSFGLIGSA